MSSVARAARLLAAVFVLALVAVACAGDRPTVEESGAQREVDDAAVTTTVPGDVDASRTLRLAVGSGWTADPGAAGPASVTNRVVAALLYEGLTRLDRAGDVQPGLAEQWFVSDDRLRWTFLLPEGLTDNQGLVITARDVKASLERLAARGSAVQSTVQLQAISGWSAFAAGESGGAAGITAVDERTLVIRLDEPFEPLPFVLAQPAFGVTAVASDGTIRTTGAFAFGGEDELVAVDPDAAIARIELVVSEEPTEALLADALVDWGVLGADDADTSGPAAVIRQPLDLVSGLVVRLPDAGQRQAILAALNGAELALELDHVTVAVAPVPERMPDQLPTEVTVHLPEGPLAALEDELAAQLAAAGVEATTVVLPAAAFAEVVASGEAEIFPMVMAGSGFGRTAGVSAALPGGADDLFGLDDGARGDLVAEIRAVDDADEWAILSEALVQQLQGRHLWLPLGNAEVRIGLSDRMGPLRVLPDATLDLSDFPVG